MQQVDIIIPVFQRIDILKECLEKLESTTSIDYRLTIIDDASPNKEVQEYIRSLPMSVNKLRNHQNLGFPGTCNKAAKNTYNNYLLFLNSDVIPLPGWLDVLVDVMEQDKKVGVVGPLLLFHPNTPRGRGGHVQHAGLVFNYQKMPWHRFLNWPADHPKVQKYTDTLQAVTGACFLTRRKIWNELGGFSQVYGRGCLTGDTYIFTEDGIKQLKDIMGPTIISEIGLHVADRYEENRANIAYINGIDDCYKVTLDGGYEISGTNNHKVVVMGEDGEQYWKEISELSINDFVAIKSGSNIFGTNHIDDDMAYLVGLYVSEGCFESNSNRLTIANGDPEIEQFLVEKFNFIPTKNSLYKFRKTGLNNFLTDLGFVKGIKASGKVLPQFIMDCDKQTLINVLQGMFDGDGTSRKNGAVNYSSNSLTLIKQLQMILLNFGITSRIYFHMNYKGQDSWYLYILMDAQKFYNEIGFRLQRKQERQKYLPERRGYIMPYQKSWMLKLYHYSKTYGSYEGRNYYAKAFSNRKSEHSSEMNINRLLDIRSNFSETPEYIHLQELIEGNYFWGKVKTIEYDGKRATYDLHVPETNSYIANGLVVHNTFEDTEFCVQTKWLAYKIAYTPDAMLYHWVGASADETGGFPITLNYSLFAERVGGGVRYDEWLHL